MHPNLTLRWDSFKSVEHCTDASRSKVGCLFDVLRDPEERHDLALEMPQQAALMLRKLQNATRHWFNPERGKPSEGASKKGSTLERAEPPKEL